jgi:hypothetical protein
MTAIKKYKRLEAVGLWLDNNYETSKEVIVSFGKTSILITDKNEVPLTHWSIYSVFILKKEGERVVYSVDSKGQETLEIDDPDMIKAISLFSKELKLGQGKRLLQKRSLWFFITLVSLFLIFFSPFLIKEIAVRTTTTERARLIIIKLLADKEYKKENICYPKKTMNPLEKLIAKENSDKPILSIEVVQSLSSEPYLLPGAILKIPSQYLRKISSPKAIISIIRTAKKLSKTQKLTKLLFSDQSYFNILKYIVGRPYKFQIDNKVFFKLDGPIPHIEGKVNKTFNITDQEWIEIQNICFN